MTVDLSVFDRLKTKADYDRAEEEFQLKKLAAMKTAQGSTPAAIQIANEYAKARQAGDVQRMNDIAIAAKSFDKGVVYDQMGNPIAMGGYGDAVGSIAGAKKGYEADAQNWSDYNIDPMTEGLKEEEKLAAQREAKRREESDTNEKVLPAIEGLRELNQQSPTIPYAGKTQVFRRLYPGTSSEESAVDLMRQQRLELAAPLAKQLGVNPTDKDFQATLDRIFDIEASKESRALQIDALANRIQARQQQLNPKAPPPFDPRNVPTSAVKELRSDPSPEARAEFDETFGIGASQFILGK